MWAVRSEGTGQQRVFWMWSHQLLFEALSKETLEEGTSAAMWDAVAQYQGSSSPNIQGMVSELEICGAERGGGGGWEVSTRDYPDGSGYHEMVTHPETERFGV